MRTLCRFTAVTVVAGAAFATGCASTPAPRISVGPTLAAGATGPTGAAEPTATPTQAVVDRPPSPITGTSKQRSPRNDRLVSGRGPHQAARRRHPLLRLHETPAQIEVHFIDRPDAQISGLGDSALPPVARALANALYRATGQRLRETPLRLPA